MSSPTATITHVTIFGNRNAGKSSLFNAIINQDIAIVDDTLGTTTDPVHKRIELLPYGPILLTDTAGLDDDGCLGLKRVDKVRKMFSRTDFGIVVVDACENHFDLEVEKEIANYDIPYIKVFNKCDKISTQKLKKLRTLYPKAWFMSANSFDDVLGFKDYLIKNLGVKTTKSIIGKYLNAGDKVVLVVPIDSEAPKGRLILPQVQLLRDLLDYNINAIVTTDMQLENIIKTTDNIKLVVTDSQVFHKISDIVPKGILLTSFSILFANYKSSLKNYNTDLSKVKNIRRVLIFESCTHNVGHEDIGMVKIPNLLKKRFGSDITINHVMGADSVEDFANYDLIIHCGSCMLNDSVIKYRLQVAKQQNVLFTNYGLYLAFEANILSRSIEFYESIIKKALVYDY